MRRAALSGLARTCQDEIDRKLLDYDFSSKPQWTLDPQSPITAKRISEAAKRLKRPSKEIRQRYKRLAERFGLKLE